MKLRWNFKASVTIILVIMVNQAYANNYYEELLELEKSMLNGNAFVKKKVDELGQKEKEFNKKESDLYQLLVAQKHYMHSELKEARNVLTSLSKEAQSSDIKAKANITLAGVEHIIGNNVEAFVALDKAINALPAVSRARYRIGILQTSVGIYKEAELFEYALEVGRRLQIEAQKHDDETFLCVANYELGTIELMVGETKMSKQRLLLAKSHCENSDSKLFSLLTESFLAEIEGVEGEPEKSNARLMKVLEKVEAIGWKILIAGTNKVIAENYIRMDDFANAEKFALEAYKTAVEAQDKRRQEQAAGILAQIYSESDKKEEALKYYNEFRELNTENKVRVRQRKLAFDIARRGQL
ncbi:hypothetical protein [Kangiella shandongensis]|uniref:hypothetical protein n=1 Tax=Kangiella shandongensis TaxID=2763258 RepID=UPI001CBEF03D|nr:hypothetical protein [Kangiella shandongensis]